MKEKIVVKDWKSGRGVIVDKSIFEKNDSDIDKYFSESKGVDVLYAIRKRANLGKVIDFANRIREAGGANIIDELMPSIPEDTHSCLIANALNFDCIVEPTWNQNNGKNDWVMVINDPEKAVEIAETMGLECWSSNSNATITLPEDIGLVAEAFDSYCDEELERYNSANSTI